MTPPLSARDIKKARRKRAIERIKKSFLPPTEEQKRAEEFWSDPCWAEPIGQ